MRAKHRWPSTNESGEDWPEELEEVLGPVQVSPELDGTEMVGDLLTLLGHLALHHIGRHVALYQMSGSEVSRSAEQIETSISHCHQRLLTEYDCLAPVCWFSELGEHDPGYSRCNEDSHNALDTHQYDRFWTLGGRHPASISDGVLSLHTEQEGGGEVLQVLHTDLVVLRLERLEVTVEESDEIPEGGKHQPGGEIGTKEIEDNPGPRESDGA